MQPQAQLSEARKVLSDARLMAFWKEAAAQPFPGAPGRMLKQLGRGQSIDEIFAMHARGSISIELKVEHMSSRVFLITFGHHGPQVGDGGVWRVVFSGGAKVVRCQEQGFWIH